MARKKQQTRKTPVLLIVLGAVLLLAAVAALVMQMLANSPSAGETASGEVDTYPDVPRVSLEEAKAAFDEGQAVFVDVRGPGAYEAARVPGSVLIPLNDMESRWNELDPNDWIITYCT